MWIVPNHEAGMRNIFIWGYMGKNQLKKRMARTAPTLFLSMIKAGSRGTRIVHVVLAGWAGLDGGGGSIKERKRYNNASAIRVVTKALQTTRHCSDCHPAIEQIDSMQVFQYFILFCRMLASLGAKHPRLSAWRLNCTRSSPVTRENHAYPP